MIRKSEISGVVTTAEFGKRPARAHGATASRLQHGLRPRDLFVLQLKCQFWAVFIRRPFRLSSIREKSS